MGDSGGVSCITNSSCVSHQDTTISHSPPKHHYISSSYMYTFFQTLKLAIEKLHNFICICIHTITIKYIKYMMLEVGDRQPILIFCKYYVSNNLYLFLYFETLPLVFLCCWSNFAFPWKLHLATPLSNLLLWSCCSPTSGSREMGKMKPPWWNLFS